MITKVICRKCLFWCIYVAFVSIRLIKVDLKGYIILGHVRLFINCVRFMESQRDFKLSEVEVNQGLGRLPT